MKSYLQTRLTVARPNVPAGSSQTMVDFLTTRAQLMNARAQMHNQLVQQAAVSGQSPSAAQVQHLQQEELQTFRQQYGAPLHLQSQRAQALASESAPAAETVVRLRDAHLVSQIQQRAQANVPANSSASN